MAEMTRRGFATNLAVAAATLAVGLPPRATAQAFVPTRLGPITMVGPGKFAATTVVTGVVGSAVYGHSDRGPITVQVDRRLNLWKGQYTRGLTNLEPGDFLCVWGRVGVDGALWATELAANPYRKIGQVVGLNGASILMRTDYEKPTASVELTNVLLYDTVSFYKGAQYRDLAVGVTIDVIGDLGRDGVLHGSSVWVMQ